MHGKADIDALKGGSSIVTNTYDSSQRRDRGRGLERLRPQAALLTLMGNCLGSSIASVRYTLMIEMDIRNLKSPPSQAYSPRLLEAVVSKVP